MTSVPFVAIVWLNNGFRSHCYATIFPTMLLVPIVATMYSNNDYGACGISVFSKEYAFPIRTSSVFHKRRKIY
jgi:hypothetical protein